MNLSSYHKNLQDEQYLFILSSTYAWEEAIEFCDKSILGIEQSAAASASTAADASADEYYFDEHLDSRLHSNDNKRNEEAAKILSLHQWLRYVYRQLTFCDQYGNTPLHAQCFCKPPVDSIMALFRLARVLRRFSSCDIIHCRGKYSNSTIWASICKDGSTPFLVASSTGASTEVLHCYLTEIQYYIDHGWVNNNNNSNSGNNSSISSSEEWARKTVIRPDYSGNTPLICWMAHHNGWIKRQLYDHSSSSSSRHQAAMLSDYWELAQRILQFVTHIDIDSNNQQQQQAMTSSTTHTLIQKCASISMYCPVTLLEWVVSPHRQGVVVDTSSSFSQSSLSWTPADIYAATPDGLTGKLPFHVAMEARPFSFDSSSSLATKATAVTTTTTSIVGGEGAARLEKNRIQMLKKLLKWYPGAADVPFRLMKSVKNDALPSVVRSRSPFLQSIVFGGSWWYSKKQAADCNNGGNYNDDDDDNDVDYMGLVQLLWRLNPEQTAKRDEVTGLFPFMLAAAASTAQQHYVDGGDDDDVTVLDTTYNLLRKDPHALRPIIEVTDELEAL